MIISSWNVNSVRARIENIKEYLNKFSPDILMMQEIKTPDETYPYDDIKNLKYENYVFGQKSYNGVAIISKKKLDGIKNDIFKDKNKQSRIISAEVKHKKKTITLINIYTPNGNPVDTEKYTYKLYWLDSLIKKLKSLSKKNENITATFRNSNQTVSYDNVNWVKHNVLIDNPNKILLKKHYQNLQLALQLLQQAKTLFYMERQ